MTRPHAAILPAIQTALEPALATAITSAYQPASQPTLQTTQLTATQSVLCAGSLAVTRPAPEPTLGTTTLSTHQPGPTATWPAPWATIFATTWAAHGATLITIIRPTHQPAAQPTLWPARFTAIPPGPYAATAADIWPIPTPTLVAATLSAQGAATRPSQLTANQLPVSLPRSGWCRGIRLPGRTLWGRSWISQGRRGRPSGISPPTVRQDSAP